MNTLHQFLGNAAINVLNIWQWEAHAIRARGSCFSLLLLIVGQGSCISLEEKSMFESFFLAQDNWWQPTRKYLGSRKNKHLIQIRENKERLENKHRKQQKCWGKLLLKQKQTLETILYLKKKEKRLQYLKESTLKTFEKQLQYLKVQHKKSTTFEIKIFFT